MKITKILTFAFATLVLLSCGGKNQTTQGPEGALSGVFSVSASKKVLFSQGNLQYLPATGEWQFAKQQYDYVGLSNKKISETYDGWIDLFGWGTSGAPQKEIGLGYVHCSAPTSVELTPLSYGNGFYGPMEDEKANFFKSDLTAEGGLFDWGIRNPIINGGNKPGLWRTLTYAEWVYLLFERPKASQLLALGSISGINGLFICPDNYNADNVLQTIATSGYKYTEESSVSGFYNQYGNFADANAFTEKEWEQLEKEGIVFLPTSGCRYGKSVSSINNSGWYWTATHTNVGYGLWGENSNAQCIWFDGLRVLGVDEKERCYGYAVRLVQDIE